MDIPSSYSSTDPCPVYNYSYPDTPPYTPVQTLDTSMQALRNFNSCADADKNDDKIITPAEYFPGPATFGTRTANAGTYLPKSQANITEGLTLINTAVTNKLELVNTTLGGVSLTTEAIADVNHYKHYLTELISSFSGTTTSIVEPAETDCWNSVEYYPGYYMYSADTVFDPTYNTADLTNCLFTYQTHEANTVPLNLGAIFSITDFRNASPNYTIDSSGNIDSNAVSSTLGGLIPGGVLASWFNMKTVYYHFNFQNMVNSSTTTIISSLPSTGVTLSIGGKSLTPAFSCNAYTGSNYCYFYGNTNTLPTADSYISVNDMQGVTATLTVPGYAAKQITVIGDSYSSTGLSLTPAP
jgi:hypothetical protein